MGWQGKRGTRQERGYGAEYGRARAIAMSRDFHLCQPCKRAGRVTPATECDHIIPMHKGGTNEATNLQGICRECHKEKTEREAAESQGRRTRPNIGSDGWPLP